MYNEIEKGMELGDISAALRALGVPEDETAKVRQRMERKRRGAIKSTMADVLSFKCIKEVAAGRLDPAVYKKKVLKMVPDSDEYKDSPESVWAIMYALWVQNGDFVKLTFNPGKSSKRN